MKQNAIVTIQPAKFGRVMLGCGYYTTAEQMKDLMGMEWNGRLNLSSIDSILTFLYQKSGSKGIFMGHMMWIMAKDS